MSDKPLYHTAYEIYALNDAQEAVSLDLARGQIKQTIVHDKPLGLTPAQLEQRNQILSIAMDILKTKARRALDSASKNWQEFQKHESQL